MKYRKKRTSRILTRSPYVAKQGLNVSPSSRYFSPLPYKMDVRTDWLGDTRYEHILGGGITITPRTECHFVFLDPLNMTNPINSSGYVGVGNQYFWSADMGAMLQLYQEAVIRSSVLNMELTADYLCSINNNVPEQAYESANKPTINFACAQVPLTYLRTSAGALFTIAAAGTPQQGVDYYSALTQAPGAKCGTITYGESGSTFKARLTIDGYAHNGVQQTITSSMNWVPAAQGSIPVITNAFPNPGQRNVFLLAWRYRYNPVSDVVQTVQVRASFKLEQHLVLQDKYPAFPYILGNGAAA